MNKKKLLHRDRIINVLSFVKINFINLCICSLAEFTFISLKYLLARLQMWKYFTINMRLLGVDNLILRIQLRLSNSLSHIGRISALRNKVSDWSKVSAKKIEFWFWHSYRKSFWMKLWLSVIPPFFRCVIQRYNQRS
jgi:hypothetical protein